MVVFDLDGTLMNSLTDLADLERRRKELTQTADDMFCQWQQEYAQTYIERILCSDADSQIRGLALELVPEKYVLSKMHTKYARIENRYGTVGGFGSTCYFCFERCRAYLP